ncbi:hypothetical protein [Aeromonas hydrophila]|uniref:hypothetical protein n=1 Tax=Aeromonas hydrophila TaxID=644 RepID=UPI002B45CC8F|nr:hypothetical protein [Aeromonas hydrophila]
MTLEQAQNVEREKLERLLNSMENRAVDLKSLMNVLSACKDINGLDPLPHLKAALRHYLEIKDNRKEE